MKKLFVTLIAVIAVVTLSSFVIANHHSSKTEMGNDFIYYTKVTAWHEETDSYTIYIYYREGNGVRKYYSGRNPSISGGVASYEPIRKNSLYHSSACNDFRRNYRYVEGPSHYLMYFNCNLPYFNE